MEKQAFQAITNNVHFFYLVAQEKEKFFFKIPFPSTMLSKLKYYAGNKELLYK